jgi:hypothetical protein
MKDILGFSRTPKMRRVMAVNGFYASIMRTEKKKEGSSKELPPGLPIPVLPVDYLKVRPDDWIGGAGSFVIPVQPDWALWFNWTMNNPKETSVLASVKGMNPLTGQSFEDFKLDKFDGKCPVHGCDFLDGNMCPECGYKWPEQNFFSDPNPLYCDGFLQPNGEVRQFYFTEDMQKSIPELVIGKEKTVPAFGFCFYKIKNPKDDYEDCTTHRNEFPKEESYNFGGGLSRGTGFSRSKSIPITKGGPTYDHGGDILYSASVDYSSMKLSSSESVYCCSSSISNTDSSDTLGSVSMDTLLDVEMSPSFSSSVMPKDVGVGAGAAIEQRLIGDKRDVSSWEEEPGAVIRLYFVFQEEFESYAAHGLKDLSGSPEGFLTGLPKGGSDE